MTSTKVMQLGRIAATSALLVGLLSTLAPTPVAYGISPNCSPVLIESPARLKVKVYVGGCYWENTDALGERMNITVTLTGPGYKKVLAKYMYGLFPGGPMAAQPAYSKSGSISVPKSGTYTVTVVESYDYTTTPVKAVTKRQTAVKGPKPTPRPTAKPTPRPTPKPTAKPTPKPTPVATPDATPSPTLSATPSNAPSARADPTAGPSSAATELVGASVVPPSSNSSDVSAQPEASAPQDSGSDGTSSSSSTPWVIGLLVLVALIGAGSAVLFRGRRSGG